ncbi:hypothetical protein C8Q80DRAFT_1282638 [Daedaleopsis nitida]|nr:hypothetical protein C8Q80DRAFT_1282638 [Daedaleopsis nitida]
MLRPTLSLLSVSSLLCVVALVDTTWAVNVTWITPAAGDSYASGDTIIGRWDADNPVVSPSFRLCMHEVAQRRRLHDEDEDEGDEDEDDGTGSEIADDGTCGEAVWPTIEHSDTDDSYMIHMSLPKAPSVAHCHLEMVDDFGDKMPSPPFTFGPAVVSATSPSSIIPTDPSQPSSVQSTDAPPDASPSPSPSPASASAPTASSDRPQTTPLLDETRMPAPTAAYAVPLALVLSVLLAAGGLVVRQRRKLRAERLQDKVALKSRQALSRHSTLSYAGFVALGSGRAPLGSRTGSSAGSAAGSGPGAGLGLGLGAGAGAEVPSRSTSVSLMRAWRRDLSRYERRGRDQPPGRADPFADDETFVARTDDGRSVVSASSSATDPKRRHGHGHKEREREREVQRPYEPEPPPPPQPQARRTTREPFPAGFDGDSTRHGDGDRARRTGHGRAFPAGGFLAAASPITHAPLYAPDDHGHGHGRRGYQLRDGYPARRDFEHEGEPSQVQVRRSTRSEAPREDDRNCAGASTSVTDDIMSRYCDFSPIPLSPAPPSREGFAAVVRPERLYVRRYAEGREFEPSAREVDRDLYGGR